MQDWIKNLKIGDDVLQVERHPNITNRVWRWKAKVYRIEPNFIETEFFRDSGEEWLVEQTKRLAVYHRTFITVWQKNYFDLKDGTIDLENVN